jgi:hypothetical protein
MLPTKATGTTLGTALRLTALWFLAHGAAPESNRPSVGLPRLTDFEDFQRNQLLAGENLRAKAVRASLRAGPRFRLGRAYAAPTSR